MTSATSHGQLITHQGKTKLNRSPRYDFKQFGHHFERYRKLRLISVKEKTVEREEEAHTILWNHLTEWGFEGDELTVKKEDLQRYAETIFRLEHLANNSKRSLISLLKSFYDEAVKQDWIVTSPYSSIRLPKEEKNPIKVMTVKEMKQFLEVVKPDTVKGLRDRALFELMYSSALRVGDIPRITKKSFGEDYRTIRVIGKGDKECVLPVGRVAAHFVKFYVEEVFDGVNTTGSEYLFSSFKSGKPLGKTQVSTMIYQYASKIFDTHKSLGTHIFRFSCITHLAEHGVDIRVLQEFARHQKPGVTMRYIQENFRSMEDVFKKTHPRSD